MMQAKQQLMLKDFLKTYYNEITEKENEIPSNNGLATTAALTAIESKIPDGSNPVKKTDYDAKVSDIEITITLLMILLLIR